MGPDENYTNLDQYGIVRPIAVNHHYRKAIPPPFQLIGVSTVHKATQARRAVKDLPFRPVLANKW